MSFFFYNREYKMVHKEICFSIILVIICLFCLSYKMRYRASYHVSCCKASLDSDILILGVATHENEHLESYKTSVLSVGYQPVVLGLGNKWNGFFDKFRYVRDYLIQNQVQPNKLICYTDTYDVLFKDSLKPPENNKLIISSESSSMGGNVSAPIPNVWEKCGNNYNKYINSGFVYGNCRDILHMTEWCLEYAKNVKYKDLIVFDKNKMRKTKWKDEWSEMTEEEYNNIEDSMCKDDQIMLCLYANEFSEKIHLDRDEIFVTSVMEQENFNIETLSTKYGKPSVIHIPFMSHRMDFYKAIRKNVFKSFALDKTDQIRYPAVTLSPKIPKIIWQTYSKKCAPDLLKNYAKGYETIFYTDEDCEEYLKKNYGHVVHETFVNYKSGAHKADLWRYCILYQYGGYYFDIKTVAYESLDDIFDHDDNKYTWYTCLSTYGGQMYQGILVTPPANPIIKKLIEDCIRNPDPPNYADYIRFMHQTIHENFGKVEFGITETKKYTTG